MNKKGICMEESNKRLQVFNGFIVLLVNLIFVGLTAYGIYHKNIILSIGVGIPTLFLLSGYFILNPKDAVVGLFFGSNRGDFSEAGFWWRNPFYLLNKVSIKVESFETSKSKITDKDGKPIEVAMIIAWKVGNPYNALFSVESYKIYVKEQSEAIMRQVLTAYTYKDIVEDKEQITSELKKILDENLNQYGIDITTAKLSHIAYSPEVAGDMLQKQKAIAIIEARKTLVEGATKIVTEALDTLTKESEIKMDDVEKARLISNLLVVLVGSKEASPVISVD